MLSRCLLYTDDLKIFMKIRSYSDGTKLQQDLDAIVSWCKTNRLNLNIKKCNVMSYTRLKSSITINYHHSETFLNRVSVIKDLGIVFVPSLRFGPHVDHMLAKACMTLGFIIRSTRNFNNTSAINLLYVSLVRSILEFGVVIWNSPHSTFNSRIEAVQKRYIRYFFRKIHWSYDKSLPYWENMKKLPPYNDRCAIDGLDSLSIRRDNLCTQFVSDIICARVDSSELLSRIKLNVPSYQLREYKPIYLENHRCAYLNNASLYYASDKFNSLYDYFDFNLSKLQFKCNLKSVVN